MYPTQNHHSHVDYQSLSVCWSGDNNRVSPSCHLLLFLPLHLRHQQLTSGLDQLLFKWTMLHTSKKGMKNMGMSVLMVRTVPVFFAALRIVEREHGGMEEYISALRKWTPMPASFSQLPSVCLTWCIGYHIFTFKSRRKSVIWALLTEFLRVMVS